MNLTPQQMTWYRTMEESRRRAMAAYAAGAAKSREQARYEAFEKSFRTYRKYFHSGFVSDYDYAKASGRFPVPPAGCSAVRSGNLMGRNLDYYYDELPEVLVTTPAANGRYATMAVTQFPGLKESDVDARNAAFRESVGRLPFPVMDGMNEHGLVTEQNMLPVGDNPDWPEELNSFPGAARALHPHWNRTYHTCPGKERRSASMLQRTVLDACRNVEEAVALITGGYDWFSFFGLAGDEFVTSGLELHWMISDPARTVVVEFVNPEYQTKGSGSVSDVVAHWFEKSASGAFSKARVTRYRTGAEIAAAQTAIGSKPIMTNFYLTGWDGDASGFGRVPVSNRTLTRYAMGLERYKVLADSYGDGFGSDQMLACMLGVQYSDAYKVGGDSRHSGEFAKIWYSEYNDPLESSFQNGVHIGLAEPAVESRAEETCVRCAAQIASGRRGSASDPDCPWITVNRSAYDMENRTLDVVVQEDGEVRRFGFA